MTSSLLRRRPHPAWRARNIAAGVSAAVFVGLGGVMAVTNTASAGTPSSSKSSTTSPAVSSNTNADNGFQYNDDGASRNFGGWSAQPPQSGVSPGASNTSSHGS